jgi:hypothetical protein
MEQEYIQWLNTFDDKYKKAIDDYTDKLETYRILDKTEKPLLAMIASEEEGSEAKRERLARADERYDRHIRDMAKAEKEMVRAKEKRERLLRKHSQTITLLSLEKEKMKLV